MALWCFKISLLAGIASLLVIAKVTTAAWSTNVDGKTKADHPVKIFLLAGQSNMVGMAKLEHLQELIHSNDSSSEEYKTLLDISGYAVRDDVFFKFNDFAGNLTVDSFPTFGPEVGFGWTIGDNMEGPILLLKTAWGGRNLAIDFRPPSSGTSNFDNVKPHQYGWEYRQMIQDIGEALNKIAEIIPGYDENVGYELSGFVWFQGWNDMLVWPFVMEYQRNLINFIRDVRLDLDAPGLPMLIGELGVHGLHPTGRGAENIYAMRAIEENTTLLEEFRNNSIFVRTAPYVIENATKRWGGDYHYDGRADTMFHIGKAFGRGMLELLSIKPSGRDYLASLPKARDAPSVM